MLKLGKVFFSILIIYILWFKEALGDYPVILYGTFMAGFVCTIAELIYHREMKISGIPGMYIAFGIYSLISGLLVAKNFAWFTSSMMTYFAFALACFCIHYISHTTGSFDWVMGCINISATLCAIYTLVAGVDYKTEVIVRTMSAENNPHTLGLMMTFGIFTIVVDQKKVEKRFWLNLIFLALYLIVILLCGSRKTLIVSCILIVIWVVNILKTERNVAGRKISLYLGLIAVIAFGIYYVKTYYMASTSFERLMMLKDTSGAANTRWELYLEAFEFWKQSPLLGIGFGQFQILSRHGYYSHSSYAEILSCTGLIGVLIFFIPLVKMTFEMINELRVRKWKNGRYGVALCLAMLLAEWILGIGQIYIYGFDHMLMLTILYARLKESQSEHLLIATP